MVELKKVTRFPVNDGTITVIVEGKHPYNEVYATHRLLIKLYPHGMFQLEHTYLDKDGRQSDHFIEPMRDMENNNEPSIEIHGMKVVSQLMPREQYLQFECGLIIQYEEVHFKSKCPGCGALPKTIFTIHEKLGRQVGWQKSGTRPAADGESGGSNPPPTITKD